MDYYCEKLGIKITDIMKLSESNIYNLSCNKN